MSTPERVAAAPDVPTIGETIKGFEATGWQGLYAPAGDAARDRRQDRRRGEAHLRRSAVVKAALENVGGEPAAMTPDAFAAFARAERVKWAEVVKAAGVRIE